MPFSSPFARSLYESQSRAAPASPTNGRAAPSTPQQQSDAPTTPTVLSSYPSPLPATPTSAAQTPTGRWQHPVVSLIPELQRKNAPNDTTIKKILFNAVALAIVYKTAVYMDAAASLVSIDLHLILYVRYALYSLLSYNIAENVRRFGWTISEAAAARYDLTEGQRRQLNLPASPASAASARATKVLAANASRTPGSQSLTPPRYQKQNTPSPSASRIVLEPVQTTPSGAGSSSRRRSSLSAGGSAERRQSPLTGSLRQSPLGRPHEARSMSLQAGSVSGSPLAVGRW